MTTTPMRKFRLMIRCPDGRKLTRHVRASSEEHAREQANIIATLQSPHERVKCPCGDGSCVLCDDDGMVLRAKRERGQPDLQIDIVEMGVA